MNEIGQYSAEDEDEDSSDYDAFEDALLGLSSSIQILKMPRVGWSWIWKLRSKLLELLRERGRSILATKSVAIQC